VQVTVAFLFCIYEQAGANVEIDGTSLATRRQRSN